MERRPSGKEAASRLDGRNKKNNTGRHDPDPREGRGGAGRGYEKLEQTHTNHQQTIRKSHTRKADALIP